MRLDGNAAAGALQEVFPFDATLALATCAECGARGELGGASAYLDGPGVVLRCASCESVLLRLARNENRIWLELSGCASLEVRT
jgi:Family of unknown function (DUF6510)